MADDLPVYPAAQRYVIAWNDRNRAADAVVRAMIEMSAIEDEARRLIAVAPERHLEVGLLDGKFKLSLAPNGRDIMVMPVGP